MSDPLKSCRHIFTGGHQCGSPALRGEELCFYHAASRRPQHHQTIDSRTQIALPEPNDLHAVQRGLAELLRLTAANRITLQQSSALRRLLADASRNLARIDRQTAALAKTDPDRAPVHDYTNHPTLGTIAPEAQPLILSEAKDPETGETPTSLPPQTADPLPPLPTPVLPFTLAPEVENLRSQAAVAQAEFNFAKAYQTLADEVHTSIRRRHKLAQAGHEEALARLDRKLAEDLEVRSYLEQYQDFEELFPDTPRAGLQPTPPTRPTHDADGNPHSYWTEALKNQPALEPALP